MFLLYFVHICWVFCTNRKLKIFDCSYVFTFIRMNILWYQSHVSDILYSINVNSIDTDLVNPP